MPEPPARSVAIATELRPVRTPDGAFWVPASFGHDHWSAYLGPASPPVRLVARTDTAASAPEGWDRLDGPRVGVLPLPALRPGLRAPADLWEANRRLSSIGDEAVLLVLPGIVGTLVLARSLLQRRPFSVKVVGDPLAVSHDANVVNRPIGRFLAWTQRLACRRAAVAGYVTERYLQERYPCRPEAEAGAVSSVAIARFATGAARPQGDLRRIATVAFLDQPYKRVDLLLEAVAALRAEGWDLAVDVVGDGRLRPTLEALAGSLGLGAAATFHGHLEQEEVVAILGGADAFALCSDTEGLPRALLEAMAAGLPCVGSAVGGIPELLRPASRFEPGSLDSLVGALRRLLVSPSLRAAAAADAIRRAADFDEDLVAARQTAFGARVLEAHR